MAVSTSDNRDRPKLIQTALKRFEMFESTWTKILQQGLLDDKMENGDQWDHKRRQEREDDGRPCMTFNRLAGYTNKMVGQQRINRPQIKVSPVEADRRSFNQRVDNLAGTNDYSYAEIYNGVIKNIEITSRADAAYDTAYDHAVTHGFGYFTIANQYTNDDVFEQDIKIKRVKNSYNVRFDLAAQEADFSDMKWAFVYRYMHKDEFQKKYPGKNYNASFNDTQGTNYEGWLDGDDVRVADYYYIEETKVDLVQVNTGEVYDGKKFDKVKDELAAKGIVEIKRRKVKRNVVKMAVISDSETLEGPYTLPCTIVPLIVIIGREKIVDGQVYYNSAIRHAHDSQRAYNFWRTAAIESVAQSPKAPYLLTPLQIEGHEGMWDNANQDNPPYLLYNPDEQSPGPPTRNFQTMVPAAEISQSTQAIDDMNATIGIYEPSLGNDDKDRSGKALRELNVQADIGTFTFDDNLSRGMQKAGRILIEMIPQVYDTNRIMRIKLPDGEDDFVEINKTITDEQSGEEVTIHDLSFGKYDAAVEIGPSYATQRQEASDSMLDFLSKLPPEKAAACAHLIAKNQDWPGADEIYGILRKMLPDNLKTQEEKEKDLPKGFVFDEQGNVINEATGEPMPPAPPPPEVLKEQAEAEAAQIKVKGEEIKLAGIEAKSGAEIKTAEADSLEAEVRIQEINAKGMFDSESYSTEIMNVIEEKFGQVEGDIQEQIADAMIKILPTLIQKVKSSLPTQQAPAGSDKADSDKKPDKVLIDFEIKYGKDGKPIKVKPIFDSMRKSNSKDE